MLKWFIFQQCGRFQRGYVIYRAVWAFFWLSFTVHDISMGTTPEFHRYVSWYVTKKWNVSLCPESSCECTPQTSINYDVTLQVPSRIKACMYMYTMTVLSGTCRTGVSSWYHCALCASSWRHCTATSNHTTFRALVRRHCSSKSRGFFTTCRSRDLSL